MMQQINFYLPEFQPNREPFRSSQLLLLLVVMIVLLLIVTIKTYSNNKELEKNIAQESLQTQALKNQLQEFANSKNKVNQVELDNKIIKIKYEIARRQQLLEVISSQRLGNDRGFSAQLEAMARQANSQISLEIFSIKRGGTYVELVGKTTSADKLPAYLRALYSEDFFHDVGFGVLQIEPAKSRAGVLQFVLAEQKQESAGEPESAVQVYVKESYLKKGTGNEYQ